MSIITTSTITKLLVQLAQLGVDVVPKDGRISLKPASRLSSDYLNSISACKPDLMALLLNPRLRWRAQAQALIADVPTEDRGDLLDMFGEREAIAAVHGELDDHSAGQLAYKSLLTHLQEEH